MGKRNEVKMIQANWENFSGLDDTVRLPVCLTLRERRMLALVAEYLGWVTRWDNYDGTPQDAMEKVATISSYLMMDNCMRITQSTDNPCHWLISYDGGATWQLMFDMSLCLPSSDIFDVNIAFTDWEIIFNEWLDIWFPTKDIWVLFPPTEYGQGNDTNIDTAICYAAYVFVLAMSRGALELIAAQLIAKDILQFFGVILQQITLLAFGNTLKVQQLVASMLADISDANTWNIGLNPAPYTDTVAIDELVCAIKDQFTGQQMTQAQFLTQPLAGGLSSSALILRTAWNDMPKSTEMYLAFMGLVNEFIPLAASGVVICPCDGWVQEFDFTLGAFAADWSIATAGFYDPGVWYFGQHYTAPGDINSQQLVEIETLENFRMTGLKVWFSIINPDYEDETYYSTTVRDRTSNNLILGKRLYETLHDGTTETMEWVGNQLVEGLLVYNRDMAYLPLALSMGTISKVRIAGTGANPFDGTP